MACPEITGVNLSDLSVCTVIGSGYQKQVPKLLWTWKVPACLLHLLYAYSKPCLCINIHHYAPPIGSTVQCAAGSEQQRHWLQAAWVLVKFQCQVLNR